MDLEEEGLWRDDDGEDSQAGKSADDDGHDHDHGHDDSDDDEELDEDDGLLDPDCAGLAAWVEREGVRYVVGQRYVGGDVLENARDGGGFEATLPQRWQMAWRDCRGGIPRRSWSVHGTRKRHVTGQEHPLQW